MTNAIVYTQTTMIKRVKNKIVDEYNIEENHRIQSKILFICLSVDEVADMNVVC